MKLCAASKRFLCSPFTIQSGTKTNFCEPKQSHQLVKYKCVQQKLSTRRHSRKCNHHGVCHVKFEWKMQSCTMVNLYPFAPVSIIAFFFRLFWICLRSAQFTFQFHAFIFCHLVNLILIWATPCDWIGQNVCCCCCYHSCPQWIKCNFLRAQNVVFTPCQLILRENHGTRDMCAWYDKLVQHESLNSLCVCCVLCVLYT